MQPKVLAGDKQTPKPRLQRESSLHGLKSAGAGRLTQHHVVAADHTPTARNRVVPSSQDVADAQPPAGENNIKASPCAEGASP